MLSATLDFITVLHTGVIGVEQSSARASLHGVSRRCAADTAARSHDDDIRSHLVQVVAAWGRL